MIHKLALLLLVLSVFSFSLYYYNSNKSDDLKKRVLALETTAKGIPSVQPTNLNFMGKNIKSFKLGSNLKDVTGSISPSPLGRRDVKFLNILCAFQDSVLESKFPKSVPGNFYNRKQLITLLKEQPKTYWAAASNGMLTVDSDVTEWVRVAKNESYYLALEEMLDDKTLKKDCMDAFLKSGSAPRPQELTKYFGINFIVPYFNGVQHPQGVNYEKITPYGLSFKYIINGKEVEFPSVMFFFYIFNLLDDKNRVIPDDLYFETIPTLRPGIFNHEIAHLFGVNHVLSSLGDYVSAWDVSSGSVWPSFCYNKITKDRSLFDMWNGCPPTMPLAGAKYFNNWIPSTSVYTLKENEEVIKDLYLSYDMDLSRSPNATRLIIVPTIDPNIVYHFEYKNKDASFFEKSIPGSGVIIHKVTRGAFEYIDTKDDGNTNPNDASSYLVPGEKFSDPKLGVSIELPYVKALDPKFITVKVKAPAVYYNMSVNVKSQKGVALDGVSVTYINNTEERYVGTGFTDAQGNLTGKVPYISNSIKVSKKGYLPKIISSIVAKDGKATVNVTLVEKVVVIPPVKVAMYPYYMEFVNYNTANQFTRPADMKITLNHPIIPSYPGSTFVKVISSTQDLKVSFKGSSRNANCRKSIIGEIYLCSVIRLDKEEWLDFSFSSSKVLNTASFQVLVTQGDKTYHNEIVKVRSNVLAGATSCQQLLSRIQSNMPSTCGMKHSFDPRADVVQNGIVQTIDMQFAAGRIVPATDPNYQEYLRQCSEKLDQAPIEQEAYCTDYIR